MLSLLAVCSRAPRSRPLDMNALSTWVASVPSSRKLFWAMSVPLNASVATPLLLTFAAGENSARREKSRLLTGSSRTRRASIVAAISGVCVLMSGASAVTVRVSASVCTDSLKGRSMRSPTPTMTFSRSIEPKPARSTRTVYSDGFRLGAR